MDDSTTYNPEKKAMPIAGFVLTIVALIAYIAYIIADWFLKVIPNNGTDLAILGGIVVLAVIAAVITSIAKKKKYGSYRIYRVIDIISWGFLAVLIIGILLKFFLK